VVVYNFEGNADKLANVCEKKADDIIKALKVPFTNTQPDNSFAVHKSAQYDIPIELEEKDTNSAKEEKPKEKLNKDQRKLQAKLKEDEKANKGDESKKDAGKKTESQGLCEQITITIYKK
jgi:hypothetical protein